MTMVSSPQAATTTKTKTAEVDNQGGELIDPADATPWRRCPVAILKRVDLRPADKLLYIYYADRWRLNSKRPFRARQDTTRVETGLGRESYNGALKRLAEGGLIEHRRTGRAMLFTLLPIDPDERETRLSDEQEAHTSDERETRLSDGRYSRLSDERETRRSTVQTFQSEPTGRHLTSSRDTAARKAREYVPQSSASVAVRVRVQQRPQVLAEVKALERRLGYDRVALRGFRRQHGVRGNIDKQKKQKLMKYHAVLTELLPPGWEAEA